MGGGNTRGRWRTHLHLVVREHGEKWLELEALTTLVQRPLERLWWEH